MQKMIVMYVWLAVTGVFLIDRGILDTLTEPEPEAPVMAVASEKPTPARSTKVLKSSKARKGHAGDASAQQDSKGHYSFDARLNGRSNRVLVDTGATSVALNLSTARRIGLDVTRADMKERARTANGEVRMAVAIIDTIEIGDVRVNDVQAAVLPDDALQNTLLGMSFLNKLDRFEVRDGKLVLYN